MARLFAAFLCIAAAAAPALAQTDTRPAFAVATVKRNTSGADAQSMRLQPGGRVTATNQPLRRLILFAYGLQSQQLSGGPGWLDTDRFDIVAQSESNLSPTPPGGPPGPAQLMFQRLLAERFGLAVHIEPREMPVYALMLARKDGRLGPRIKPADRDCLALMTAGPGGLPVAAPQLPDGRPACGARRDGSGRLAVGGSDMRMFATQMLTGQVDRLVIDRTGLAGAYDFDLEYAVEAAGRGGGPSDPATAVSDRASLFTALQEQLGLRLEPLRASVDVMVIDRVAPPTEN